MASRGSVESEKVKSTRANFEYGKLTDGKFQQRPVLSKQTIDRNHETSRTIFLGEEVCCCDEEDYEYVKPSLILRGEWRKKRCPRKEEEP